MSFREEKLLSIANIEFEDKSIEELKLKYKVTRFLVDTNFVGKVERSKLWKHKILITTKKENFKFSILKRNEVDAYESVLSNIRK